MEMPLASDVPQAVRHRSLPVYPRQIDFFSFEQCQVKFLDTWVLLLLKLNWKGEAENLHDSFGTHLRKITDTATNEFHLFNEFRGLAHFLLITLTRFGTLRIPGLMIPEMELHYMNGEAVDLWPNLVILVIWKGIMIFSLLMSRLNGETVPILHICSLNLRIKKKE